MIYRNKKNGNYYIYLGLVKNCTNKDDGKVMVSYCSFGDYDHIMYFVRQVDEFAQKFELVSGDYDKELQKSLMLVDTTVSKILEEFNNGISKSI